VPAVGGIVADGSIIARAPGRPAIAISLRTAELKVVAGAIAFGGQEQYTHPFRKSLAELQVGDGFASDLRVVNLEEISEFAKKTGDTFYAHTDAKAAEANPFFPGIVAHGYLL